MPQRDREQYNAYQRVYKRRWYATHPEEARAKHQADYLANIEKRKASHAAYRAEHRQEALERNKAYYKLHQKELSTRACAYAKAHQEENRIHDRAFYKVNREELCARKRAYREAHLEEMRLRARADQKLHPERARLSSATHRARKLSAPSSLTASQWKAIVAAYNGRCAYCGVKPKRLTMDHVVPLSRNGTHTADNVVPACLPCNLHKGNRPSPIVPPFRLLL